MTPRPVRVRPGEESDLPAVLEIYNHYVAQSPATFEIVPPTPADRTEWIRQHLSGHRYRLWVAADPDGPLLGWATSSPFRPRAAYDTTVESSVYVTPTSHGHGIGTQLYWALFDSLAREDIERVVAGIAQPNPASVRLHRRFGFEEVGTFHRVGRKFDRFWDVTWFERPLRLDRPQVPAA